MAIDQATKKEFNDRIVIEKKLINDIEKDISMYRKALTANKKMAPYFRLGISAKMIQQVNLYLKMNTLSEEMMNIKNNSYLDTARKILYKIFSELESIIKSDVDEAIDFNRDELDGITLFTPKQKINLYKHLKRATENLIKAYGQNTKWRWSFPEVYAKLSVIGKNVIDFREMQSKRDPREEFYYDRQELLTEVKEDLFEASNHYRDKFELSTKSPNDLLAAVRLLEALKRIAMVMRDDEILKKAKSGIEAYQARLESDDDEKKKQAKTGTAKKK